MGTTTRSARYREHLVEGLNGFIPSQVVAHHQNLTAVGASWEFRLIDEALLGISSFRGSHGFLLARILLTRAEFEGLLLPHDNPIFLAG